MYSNNAATLRADINTFVMEAASIEQLLIGGRVLPAYSAPNRTGQYPKIKIATGELLKRDSTERAPDGGYNEIVRTYETDTFDCIDRGLEERIDDNYRRDISRFFDAEVVTAQMILRNILLGQEIRCAAAMFNETNFAATPATTAMTEANLATFDLPLEIHKSLDDLTGKGQLPNTMILNRALFNRLRRSTKLQTYLYGNLPSGNQRIVTAQDLGGAFGLNVLIGEAKYDTAKKGASSATLTHIWSKAYIWIGNVQGGDFAAGGAGRTVVWNGDAPDLYVTETYRNEIRRSDMVRVRQNSVEKIIDQTAGYLITTNAD